MPRQHPVKTRTPPARTPARSVSHRPASTKALEARIERLASDLTRLKAQLRQSQRLVSLGTAAAMFAHEFNNMMTPVVGYARFALDSGDTQTMAKALRITLTQSESVLAMTERILGMAKDEPIAMTPTRLRGVIDDAINCLWRDLGKDGITNVVDVDESLMVRADARQLRQVFFNLFLNARDALDALEGRKGRIKTSAIQVHDRVEISISDNGCGMSTEMMSSIFDVFFTTKKPTDGRRRRGSGLGLAVCKDIITEHGGSISVKSRPNEGATFTITLRAAS